ncbi:MAG: response regulator [Defluviitaleaceae bacterium]|nr:response regulator [Defluviitaleaceae bacterium]
MKINSVAVEMLNNLPGMVYRRLSKPPNTFTFVSEGSLELTGYAPEELLKISMMELVHPKDAPKLQALYASTLDMGMPLENSYRIVTKAGDVKQVWIRAKVLDTDEEGMPLTVEGFIIDLTKYLRLETARLANRSKVDFLAKLNTEIRSPMNIVMGMADIVLRDDASEKLRDQVQSIKTAGGELISILDGVLDYTKLESGQVEIKEDVYSFSVLLKEVVEIVRARAAMSNLDFFVYADSKIPEMLVGDRARIRKILLNVLGNAIKFTDVGFISLNVNAEIINQTIDLEFSVADTGRGIKSEDLPTVLQKFEQLDDKIMTGIGLGLSNADGLTRLMGGSIQASSVHGWGSIFNIYLPQQIFNTKPIAVAGNPRSKSVIIFENRDDFREAITRTLDDLGVSHEEVESYEQFSDAIVSGDYAFAFVASMIYDEIRVAHPIVVDQREVELVLIKGTNEIISEDDIAQVLFAPLYCLPIADVLNGTYFAPDAHTVVGRQSNHASFTAPDARVLVVDDISTNLIVAEGLLGPYKMQIDLVESGQEAIEAVKENCYDIILMDYMMPIMDGAEAALEIRALEGVPTDCEHVPIVALTANIGDDAKTTFQASGFNDLIAKPIDINKLNEVMEKWIPDELQISNEMIPEKPFNTKVTLQLRIEGVDVNVGIALSGGGDFETYLRVLEKYCENGRRLYGEIADSVYREELHLYTVFLHSLRSISASIGANLMSQTARVLETAAEKGQMDFIKAKTPKLLEDLDILLTAIEDAIRRNIAHPGHIAITTEEVRENDMGNAKKKILLVDDTETFLFLLNDILKDDYETLIAKDGEDGLETAEFVKPDLILLDILMPGMSGLDVLAKLKANEELKDIPVILVSGKDSDEDRAIGHDAGATSYILKPFKAEVVREEVAKALGQ